MMYNYLPQSPGRTDLYKRVVLYPATGVQVQGTLDLENDLISII